MIGISLFRGLAAFVLLPYLPSSPAPLITISLEQPFTHWHITIFHTIDLLAMSTG